jgi:hypothetical protein
MGDNRKNRVFKTERRDVEYPMWRKKVDASIFYDKAILIPKFAEKIWDIPSSFKGVFSKKDLKSIIKIIFQGVTYNSFLTDQDGKRTGSYRIWLPSELSDILKEKFLMTFMRDLEFKLGDYDSDVDNRISIEDVIPFNEFIDIEFDSGKKEVILTAHYTQQVVFKNLFSKILDSTVLKSIALELDGKSTTSIVKSNWRPKSDLTKIPDQPNVIYFLLDEVNNEFYVGEAKSLKNRLSSSRPEIPLWSHFRYNVLPPIFEPYRLEIERMIIRDFALLMPSDKTNFKKKKISDFKLTNKKIDK